MGAKTRRAEAQTRQALTNVLAVLEAAGTLLANKAFVSFAPFRIVRVPNCPNERRHVVAYPDDLQTRITGLTALQEATQVQLDVC